MSRKLKAICEGAIMVALAQVLGYLKLFSLPSGGSITLNMLPIFLFCCRWGLGPGLIASFSLAVLQLLLDGAYAWGWQSILGDYLIGYGIIGLAGLFHNRNNGFFKGIIVGSVSRFLVAWITGAVVWGVYMPDTFFGMTMTSPWIYSALYNGSYLLVCMFLCLAVGFLLWKSMKRYICGRDIELPSSNH